MGRGRFRLFSMTTTPGSKPVGMFRLTVAVAALAFLAMAPSTAARAFETAAKTAILLDYDTGAILFEKNADMKMPPASMSKIMTVYMVFERLKSGALSLDDKFLVSEKAWRKGGSKMFVEYRNRVRVEDLLRGVIVQSGNDAAIVLAEGLAGSESAFAEEMTRRAAEMGLAESGFANATGWPADGHVMSARDIAELARRTIAEFPEYYRYYSERSFTYHGIRQGNRNPLLFRDIGADGLKTGHTEEAGFGLTASVLRRGRRLILVVSGLDSEKARAGESERLIEWGFREFENYTLFAAGEVVTEADVWLGNAPKVPLVTRSGLTLTLPRRAWRQLKVVARYDNPLSAPVAEGAVHARLIVTAPGIAAREMPLVAGKNVGRLGVTGRLSAAVRYLLWGESEQGPRDGR